MHRGFSFFLSFFHAPVSTGHLVHCRGSVRVRTRITKFDPVELGDWLTGRRAGGQGCQQRDIVIGPSSLRPTDSPVTTSN